MTTLVTGVEVDQTAAMKGGLLDYGLPMPSGWERGGVAVSFHGCRQPDVLDKCVSLVADPGRGVVGEFRPFPIEQGDVCSTLGGGTLTDREADAKDRLTATTEWALGRQLTTNLAQSASVTLADATVLGTCADVLDAVSSLEQAAADTGYGAALMLHTTIRGASYLSSLRLMDDENHLSPAGNQWVVSPGYAAPAQDRIRFWATGRVWVGVLDPVIYPDVDWRRNDTEALASSAGIVAFDPCINLAVDVTVGSCITTA